MPTVGVILSGCGVQDGSEIHEATLTLLYLAQAGADVVCFAPDNDQFKVHDHQQGSDVDETRNVLTESARLARGPVTDVREADAAALDALILPGGFGAALNLCSFATEGSDCSVEEGTAALVRAMHEAGKPIGAMCIAPAVIARVLGEHGVELTIGNNADVAAKLETMGAKHIDKPVDQIVVDREHKLVTTPAYMLATSIAEAASGIEKLVASVLSLA